MNKRLSVLVLLIVAISASSGCIETGKGVSTDTIYGIEYNGLIWDTYSIWLTNDHPAKDYSAIYTVNPKDTALVQALLEAKASGKKVNIYYRNEYWIFPPWKYTSKAVAIIESVEYAPGGT